MLLLLLVGSCNNLRIHAHPFGTPICHLLMILVIGLALELLESLFGLDCLVNGGGVRALVETDMVSQIDTASFSRRRITGVLVVQV